MIVFKIINESTIHHQHEECLEVVCFYKLSMSNIIVYKSVTNV